MKVLIPIGGTERALKTLENLLLREDIEIPLIIAMKGYDDEKIYSDSIEKLALNYKKEVIKVDAIKQTLIDKIISLNADALIGIGVWRPLLNVQMLNSTKLGFLAVHATSLPNYRGWAGIYWQIINGHKEIGLTAYKLSTGIDNGPLISNKSGDIIKSSIEINNDKFLKDILIDYDDEHIKLINKIIDLVINENINFKEQEEELATYSCHRGPSDGEINWNMSTESVFNFIRAQSYPCKGSYTYFKGKKVYIDNARKNFSEKYLGIIPGKIVKRDQSSGKVEILTKDGSISVLEARVDLENIKPSEIFNSIRERCKTRVEAYIDKFHPDF